MSSLDNARFRWLIVLVITIGVVPAFVLTVLAAPFLHHSIPSDVMVYINAANRLHAGADPYAPWLQFQSPDPTRRPGYIYPPLLAWLLSAISWLQPRWLLVGLFAFNVAALATFWLLIGRLLRFSHLQPLLFLAVSTLAFFPVQENFKWGQVNLLLLALNTVWLVGWVERSEAVGGIGLALSVAVKLLQAPVMLLALFAQRLRMLAWTVLVLTGATTIASPQYLPEYLTRVLPALSSSTSFMENLAPLGLLSRLVQPSSLFADAVTISTQVRLANWLLAAAVVVVSIRLTVASQHVSASRSVRALQGACFLCLCPLVATLDWPAHLATLLLPMVVLMQWSLSARRPAFTLGLLFVWLALGPLQQVLWTVADNRAAMGWLAYPLFWLLSELGASALLVLWAMAAVALHLETRSASRRVVEIAASPSVDTLPARVVVG